jgi:hypothetical protein
MNHIRDQRGLERIDFAGAIANNVSWWKHARSTTRDPKKRAHTALDDHQSGGPPCVVKTQQFYSLTHTHTTTKNDERGLNESNTM